MNLFQLVNPLACFEIRISWNAEIYFTVPSKIKDKNKQNSSLCLPINTTFKYVLQKIREIFIRVSSECFFLIKVIMKWNLNQHKIRTNYTVYKVKNFLWLVSFELLYNAWCWKASCSRIWKILWIDEFGRFLNFEKFSVDVYPGASIFRFIPKEVLLSANYPTFTECKYMILQVFYARSFKFRESYNSYLEENGFIDSFLNTEQNSQKSYSSWCY